MSFNFNFTKGHLEQIIPRAENLDAWYAALVKHLPEYNINTINRVAMFLAQCSYESTGFTVLQENLNYKANRLAAVFPRYFKNVDTTAYAGSPEKVANRIYANRMNNGTESSGDGWRYRGRGIIQITGKQNYTSCSHLAWKNDELLRNPDLLCSPDGAVLSACWFWEHRGINQAADNRDVALATRLVSGGTLGLEDRKHYYDKVLAVLT